MTVTTENTILSISIIFIAAINLIILIKRNAVVTAQGGFHLNMLIFYGFGPLSYGFATIYWDVLVRKAIPIYTNKVQWMIFISYVLGSLLIYKFDRKKLSAILMTQSISGKTEAVNRLNFWSLVLSVIGYTFSKSEIALSGVGTVFVVLKNLLFPALVLLIYNASIKNRFSIFLLICGFTIVGINTFVSQWRSEFIIFLFSACVGLLLRNRKFIWWGVGIGPLLFILILPFQNLKKKGEIKDSDYANAILTSVDSKVSPIDMATSFVAYRMNYGRESAYVLRGLDKGYISLKNGETYAETFTQLIPRIFWPDKPSYNKYSGFILPRKIGLSSKLDRHTSWAVNHFAEFLYNFELKFLPLFFLVYWLTVRWFDSLANSMNLLPEVKLILQFSLFFQVLTVVSIVNAATYFLWLFIVLKLINLFFTAK